MDDFHKFPDHFPTMKILLDRPFLEVIFEVQIPRNPLTSLNKCGIITGYKRRQNQDSSRAIYCSNIFPHLLDTLKFKTNIFTRLFTRRFQKFIMNNFNVVGDLGRHYLSISGASAECGISISTIRREQGKTFPPIVKLSAKRIGSLVYQVEQWLQGARGGWK